MLKTPPYFNFSVLKKKCRLSLQVVLFINSVTNRCISNTLSTFSWQHFLPTEYLRLNDFLFVPGMYNIKKSKKRIPTRNNFVVAFASKFRCINPHATWGTAGDDTCTSSVTSCATCKEESGVAGSTFDGGWSARWWQD